MRVPPFKFWAPFLLKALTLAVFVCYLGVTTFHGRAHTLTAIRLPNLPMRASVGTATKTSFLVHLHSWRTVNLSAHALTRDVVLQSSQSCAGVNGAYTLTSVLVYHHCRTLTNSWRADTLAGIGILNSVNICTANVNAATSAVGALDHWEITWFWALTLTGVIIEHHGWLACLCALALAGVLIKEHPRGRAGESAGALAFTSGCIQLFKSRVTHWGRGTRGVTDTPTC